MITEKVPIDMRVNEEKQNNTHSVIHEKWTLKGRNTQRERESKNEIFNLVMSEIARN